MKTLTNTKESGFEEFIQNELEKMHGYKIRSSHLYDKKLCMDTELVIEFIETTQPQAWEKLLSSMERHCKSKSVTENRRRSRFTWNTLSIS
jgi:hypothetical protein